MSEVSMTDVIVEETPAVEVVEQVPISIEDVERVLALAGTGDDKKLKADKHYKALSKEVKRITGK